MNLKTIKVVYDYNLYEGSSENFLLRVSNLKKNKDVLVVTHEPQILFFIDFFLSKTDFWPKRRPRGASPEAFFLLLRFFPAFCSCAS